MQFPRTNLPRRTLLALAATIVMGAPAAVAQKKPAEPLVNLNKMFRSEYSAARKATVAKAEPIIVVQFDQLVLFNKGKKTVENFTPPIYHEVKAIAHLPLTIYVTLARHAGTTLTAETVQTLKELRTRAVTARASFAGRAGWTPAVIATNQQIVDGSLAFIDATIAAGTVSAEGLTKFTRSVVKPVMRNADTAARAQLDGLHALVQKWRALLGEEAWKRTYVIVLAPRQARPGSLQYAYFQRSLGWKEEGKRLFYAENIFSAEGAVRLLGTILLDRGASVAFFAKPLRLERDLLADAAAIHVRRLIPGPAQPPEKK